MGELTQIRLLSQGTQLDAAARNLNDLQIIDLHANSNSAWDTAIDEASYITALAVTASRQTVVSYTVPHGMLGILEGLATALQNVADWDNAVWALTVNGTPVLGYDFLQGPVGDITLPQNIFIPLMAGQTVRVIVTNIGTSVIPFPTALILGRIFPNVVAELLK